MKNNSQDTILVNSDLAEKNHPAKNKITTDINILLNRVRLDKKKDLKKRLIFLSLIISIISLFVLFSIF